jgi:orotidine-5'-phosphate decarboxylase
MVPADSTTESEMFKNKIIVALDGMSRVEAFHLAKQLEGSPYLWGFKGNDLLLEGDPKDTIARFNALGNFFADYKFHDIPNTVYNQVARIANYGAALITVHGAGGKEMLQAAVSAYLERKPHNGLGILAVTVLTSITPSVCDRLYGRLPQQQALAFASEAKAGSVWGVVCSPQEVGSFSTNPDLKDLKFVTPSVRMPGDQPGDQARFDTPKNALDNGADLLVVGRPVTEAPDPRAALNAIGESIFPIRNTRA